MIEFAEKRDFLRMSIDCELHYSHQSEDLQHLAQVINLSSEGILFTCEENLEPGSALDILLTPSNSLTPPMLAAVTVSRVKSLDSVFEVACKIDLIKQ